MATLKNNQPTLNDGGVLESTEIVKDTHRQETAYPAHSEEATPPAARTSCAIGELQKAFGTLLLIRKNKNPVSTDTNKVAETEFVPHWTGVFDLFAFPRELRDRIYYHYLYRPRGLTYQRNTNHHFPFDDHPDEFAALFLTSRQVYLEAFQVFCRYNLVEFSFTSRIKDQRLCVKSLAGVLRLFPDKPARNLQHLGVTSERYKYFTYHYFGDENTTVPTDAFAQMLRDAYAFKDIFPKMRDFTVSFRDYDRFFGYSDMFEVEGCDEEEKIANCVDIMSTWLGADTVLPPRWFRFLFDESWMFNPLRTQEEIWNKAYARLAEDRADRVEPVEESGKVWIEKNWS